MSVIATKYYPVSDIFFHTNQPVSLMPGETVVGINDGQIIGIHVFNWSPNAWMILETAGGQTIRFPGTSLVEGAIYYLKINRIIEVGPSKDEVQIMAISAY